MLFWENRLKTFCNETRMNPNSQTKAATLEDRYRPLVEAVAFAARAHHGQMRKDKVTPYVSHVFRVCLIVRDLFGIDDPRVLTAALLHDTIEDTLMDFDDLERHFGGEIAGWVAALSKDKRRREKDREKAYLQQLAKGPWQVQICKLADIFDNLLDLASLPADRQLHTMQRARQYLQGLKGKLHPEVRRPFALVEQLLGEIQAKGKGT